MSFFKLTFKTMFHMKYVVVMIAMFFLVAGLNLGIEMSIEFYSGLLGIFVFGELLRHEESFHTEFFVRSIHNAKAKLLFHRISIVSIFVLFVTIFHYLLLVLLNREPFPWNTSSIELIFVGAITAIFFGLATLLVSLLSKNWMVGFLVMLSYWMIWMIEYNDYPDFFLNPFKFALPVESGVIDLKINCMVLIILMFFALRYVAKK